MSNDRANLVNPESLGDEVSDGLSSGVVKVNVGTGGAIGNSLVSGATEQNIERRPCDLEDALIEAIVDDLIAITLSRSPTFEDLCRGRGKRDLP
jgi:hypothetical protein